MGRNRLAFVLLAIVMMLCCIACSEEITTRDGDISLQCIYYETESGEFFEEESLGIDHFELNGDTFIRPPYYILNLPGNQNYSYTLNAYDAEGTLMASGSGQWMVVEGGLTTQTATLTVIHQHTYKDTWFSDALYHWHGTSCGHSATKDKAQHTFDGDVCTVCGYDKHVHTFNSSWSSNDYNHWHDATCGHSVVSDEAIHSFGPDTVVIEPKCTATGMGSHTCTVCGKTVTYSIPMVQHTPGLEHLCTICGNFVPYEGATGGYVFYDKGEYSDGWRYLEASPSDLRVMDGVPTVDSSLSGYSSASFGYTFGFFRTWDSGSNRYVNGKTTYDASNCTGTEIGTGKSNTQLLVSAMGTETYSSSSGSSKTENYAARLCDELTYTVGGETYDDWFLPSKDELNLMYLNLHSYGLGGFADNNYWTSSEYDSDGYDVNGAWVQSFYNGYQNGCDRISLIRVRAVRAF